MVSHDTFNRLWKQTSFRVIDLTTNFYYKCSLCQKKRIWPSWKEKINKIVLGCCCILGKCPEQRPTHWRHGHIIDMNSFQSLQSSIKWSGLLLTCISIKRMMDFERKKDIFKASQCMHSGLKKFLKIKFALFKIFSKSSVAYTYLKIPYKIFGFFAYNVQWYLISNNKNCLVLCLKLQV